MTLPDSRASSAVPMASAEQRFVRVTRERANGFIEFEFSIGDPEVFMEMILDRPSFAEFCSRQGARLLDPAPSASPGPEPGGWDWRLRDATTIRFKQD